MTAATTWEERVDLPDCDIGAATYGDFGLMESVVDAALFTRSQAIARYIDVTGDDWTDVRCYKRYAYFPTRREQWLRHVASDRYWGPRPPVGAPPRGWVEEEHAWWLVARSDPRGVPVWIVLGLEDPDGPPPKPVSGRGKETR